MTPTGRKTIVPIRIAKLIAIVHDLFMLTAAWIISYWLRFNLGHIPTEHLEQGLKLLPIVILIQGLVCWYFGLYRGLWRFASIPDLIRILKSAFVGVLVTVAASFLLFRLEAVPRSIFILDGILFVLLLSGPRLIYRWIKDNHIYRGQGQRTLVVGAGRTGEMLVRDLLRTSNAAYNPIIFVDDDETKIGREIHGVGVKGTCNDIGKLTKPYDIELILIAIPEIDSRQLRRIVELCEQTHLPFKILPPLKDFIIGTSAVKELREVTIYDLLGRDAVNLDWSAISSEIRDAVVMVTGGGGSIGSELCRQIAQQRPSTLIIYERSEYNLFAIERELRMRHQQLVLVSVLADICDEIALQQVMESYHPSVIYHAAAYKHVPMLENQTRTAVRNNIIGTRLVAEFADRYSCKSFVLISTDKAVNPANMMGITKRVAEMICHSMARSSKTRFITVRFGNVLGSSGSVIPIFKEQIANGGPVTVTHPDITRYFMTIPEACQLIMQANVLGKGGEIYVLDMGEPIKISYLAEQMIRLSGKTPNQDINIVYTGLRPGEKMTEELFHVGEQLKSTKHPKVRQAESRTINTDELKKLLTALVQYCEYIDEEKMTETLYVLVPEHQRHPATVEAKNIYYIKK